MPPGTEQPVAQNLESNRRSNHNQRKRDLKAEGQRSTQHDLAGNESVSKANHPSQSQVPRSFARELRIRVGLRLPEPCLGGLPVVRDNHASILQQTPAQRRSPASAGACREAAFHYNVV